MSNIRKYIKISDAVATENYGVKNGVEAFEYGLTVYGEFFTDVNTLATHPELFDVVEYIDIDYDDIIMYDEDGNIISKNYREPTRRMAPSIFPSKTKEVVEDNIGRVFTPMKYKWYMKLWKWIKKIFKK